ncbi:MAG: hypothetical protein DHS20C14_09090 [Phycisphaeraceae bacterium]|nr:MAG: hypothetical protein DHS20C14_09090 [Phycisphaeraceae bacterium]
MEWLAWVILGLALAVGLPMLVLARHPSPSGTLWSNVIYGLGDWYAAAVHGLKVEGFEHVPTARDAGPLIVVANHTAGVDPVLISARCPFHIRWIMAEDMRLPWLDRFWRWQQVIFVSRSGRDRTAMREAMAHLRAGGVIGIYPEGGLERPERQLLRFQRGVGMLIKRSGAPVLPVWVEGTPQVDPAWASLWHTSRSRVEFAPIIDYSTTGLGADEIADDLRARYRAWTGWALNEAEPTPDVNPKKATRRARTA